MNCVDNVEIESQIPNEMDLWLAKLKGVSKINVEALIEQLEEKEEIIETLEAQSNDHSNEIDELNPRVAHLNSAQN